MLLHQVVDTAAVVAATRSRLAKVEALADLLRRLAPEEIAPTVGFLVGRARQGRVGVGWRGLSAVMGEPADEPTLTVADVDALLETLLATSGSGSGSARTATLRAVTARATTAEQDFIGRVLLGEMRTGALEGSSSMPSPVRLTCPATSCAARSCFRATSARRPGWR